MQAIRDQAQLSAEPPPAAIESKLLSVCTLNSREAAQQFQTDVTAIQAQRDRAVHLQTGVDAASTVEAKAYARGQVDTVLAEVAAMDQVMQQRYGFSITRNYTLQIDRSALYVWAEPRDKAETAQVR